MYLDTVEKQLFDEKVLHWLQVDYHKIVVTSNKVDFKSGALVDYSYKLDDFQMNENEIKEIIEKAKTQLLYTNSSKPVIDKFVVTDVNKY